MDPVPPRCQFCGAHITDPMLGFLDHVERSPACQLRWSEFRENVRREAGGT